MLSAIERLLRLTNANAARRSQSGSSVCSSPGVSIFSTSAPMSARIMPGISAGGTRATSRTVMPSRTPIGISLVAVGDEARGQRPNVGNRLQVLELGGDAFGLARSQHAGATGEELRVQRVVSERLIVMTGGAAGRRGERAAVAETDGDATPGVLLETVGQCGIDDHRHARHQRADGLGDRALERREIHAPFGGGGRRAELHRELPLE